MPLKETIDNNIKEAMKAKDQVGLRALRAIKSAILLAETAEGRTPGAPLTQAEEMQLLMKQAKQRKDSIEQFKANGRTDLATGEEEELVVIEKFLPKTLSPAELEAEVKKIIAEAGAKSPADMGKVMKLATPALAGRADGKAISDAVKKLLAGA
jgi:uncharacterized protein YqeY